MTLRALVVSYNFPPVGGAGVQRMSKLVRYLPLHGVTPSVLTVANPSVPLRDASLEHDLPPDLEVVRARTFEPSYAAKAAAWNASARPKTPARRAISALAGAAKSVLVPDPQVLWLPAAAPRLLGHAQDVVLISGPPFSQFLLALLAKLVRRKPVVLDYRDEWRTYRTSYEMTASSAARAVGDRLEPAVLRCADRITTATDEFRDELLRHHAFLRPEQVITILNGYDPADFPADLPDPPADRFVVTYAGTLFKLTSAQGLLAAIRLLHERDPELARLLRLRVVGRVVETEEAHFANTPGVERVGYVPHDQVFTELAASHLALCLLDDVPGVERIYPAKIFELMHLGRPVLTLAPEGALTRLSRKHALGEIIAPRDVESIAASLARRLRDFRDGRVELRSHPRDVEIFDRRVLAGRFADVLRDAVTRRAGAPSARVR